MEEAGWTAAPEAQVLSASPDEDGAGTDGDTVGVGVGFGVNCGTRSQALTRAVPVSGVSRQDSSSADAEGSGASHGAG